MRFLAKTLLVFTFLACGPAFAQEEPPARVGRVSLVAGNIAFYGPGDTPKSLSSLALLAVSQLCITRAKLYDNSRAGDTNLRPLSFTLSISVNATRARNIAGGELDLESADRTVVSKVRARLGRVVAGEDDCHR